MSIDKSTRGLLSRQIAARTGLAVSSVSKILNGAPGYSVATRRRVEALASELAAGQSSSLNRDTLKIGVMIPEHPSYFWDEAILGVRQTIRSIRAECGRQVEAVLRFVHFPLTEQSVSVTLSFLQEQNCNAYILYPIDRPAFLAFFDSIPVTVPVVLLNDLPGNAEVSCRLRARRLTAYIGADCYDEGIRAAQILGEKLSRMQHVLALITEDSVSATASRKRIAGFTQTCREINPRISIRTETVASHGTLTSAFLAAHIEPEILRGGLDCVYVSSGVTHIASAAIRKVQRRNHLPIGTGPLCLGHECSPSDRPYLLDGTQCGYVKQDIYAQAQTAIRSVLEALRTGQLTDTYVGSSVFISGGIRN